MPNIGDAIVVEAMKHLGKPYVWATQGPNTFDCSGFVQYCYMQVTGEYITPASSAQIEVGQYVSRENLRPGDIVCYDVDGNGSCGHTGIYIGNNQHINALNETWGVHIDPVTDPVIWDGYWGGTAIFLCGRRKYAYDDNPNPGTDPGTGPGPNRGLENPTIAGTALTATLRRSQTVHDLGSAKMLAGITWELELASQDTLFDLSTSLDGVTWSSVNTFTKPLTTEKRGVKVEVQARYIRTEVVHATSAAKAGHLIKLVAIEAGTSGPGPEPTVWTHRVTSAVNFRTSASTSASIIATLPAGTLLRYISGPVSAGGYSWYNVEVQGRGTGWLVDAFEPVVGLPPVDPDPDPDPTWTHEVTNGPLNLRATASASGTLIGTMANGVKLNVISGPVSAGGYSWYNVDTETLGVGWCVNGFDVI